MGLSLASSRSRSMTVRADVLLDIADEVDVAQPIRCFLPEDAFDGVDQVRQQAVVQVAVRENVARLGSLLDRHAFRALRFLLMSVRALIHGGDWNRRVGH